MPPATGPPRRSLLPRLLCSPDDCRDGPGMALSTRLPIQPASPEPAAVLAAYRAYQARTGRGSTDQPPTAKLELPTDTVGIDGRGVL
jgi:hypothetical protein